MCKILKNIDVFSKDKTKDDGLSRRCKECQSKLSKLHYLRNKDRYSESQTRNRDIRRKFLKEAKSKPCADCNIQYPYWIMQFDHLRNKEFTIGTFGYHTGLDRLKKRSQ